MGWTMTDCLGCFNHVAKCAYQVGTWMNRNEGLKPCGLGTLHTQFSWNNNCEFMPTNWWVFHISTHTFNWLKSTWCWQIATSHLCQTGECQLKPLSALMRCTHAHQQRQSQSDGNIPDSTVLIKTEPARCSSVCADRRQVLRKYVCKWWNSSESRSQTTVEEGHLIRDFLGFLHLFGRFLAVMEPSPSVTDTAQATQKNTRRETDVGKVWID